MHSFQSAFTSMHKHVGASNDQSACSQSQHIRLTCVNLKKKVNVCLSPHIWSVGVRYIFLVPDTRYLAAVAVLGSTGEKIEREISFLQVHAGSPPVKTIPTEYCWLIDSALTI